MNDKDVNSTENKILEYIAEDARSDNSNIQLDAIKERVRKNRENKIKSELPTIF